MNSFIFPRVPIDINAWHCILNEFFPQVGSALSLDAARAPLASPPSKTWRRRTWLSSSPGTRSPPTSGWWTVPVSAMKICYNEVLFTCSYLCVGLTWTKYFYFWNNRISSLRYSVLEWLLIIFGWVLGILGNSFSVWWIMLPNNCISIAHLPPFQLPLYCRALKLRILCVLDSLRFFMHPDFTCWFQVFSIEL